MKRITAIVAGIALAMAGASGAIAQSGTLSHRALVSRGCYTHSCAKRVWVKSHPHVERAKVRYTAGWAIPTYIVMCESGGKNLPPNGAGASGYYQIIPSTWDANGGQQFASQAYLASKYGQDTVASRIWAADGSGAWDCA